MVAVDVVRVSLAIPPGFFRSGDRPQVDQPHMARVRREKDVAGTSD